jgi:hypothetical protein
MQRVLDAITNLDFSWTLDSVSEISFEVWDPDFAMLNSNYFQVRRDVTVAEKQFEMTVIEVQQGEGNSPKIKIQARTKEIQRMKRDKNPNAYGGGTATDYARAVAAQYGLKFVGQSTGTQAVQAQASNEGKADSVWDVLTKNASEAQFAVFESDGTLYFASEEWLLGKWANIRIDYPSLNPFEDFLLLEIPQCRTSEDDVRAAEIKFLIERTNAVNIRPGMTVDFNGIKNFSGKYLVTDVAYIYGDNTPVGVSVRTPVKPEPRAPSKPAEQQS